jgi:23S rRNA (pseudouridine1915-N3)-methyltransferase
MYVISVVAVGKLKEPYWKEAVAEYAKRLSAFARVETVEVPEAPFKSAGEAPAVLRAEAAALKGRIPADAFSIALVKEGRQMTTEKFAELIGREGQGGRPLAFVIGGPLGLDVGLATGCHLKLSLSAMTFTHGEARAVLFEQLYRAATIVAGKTYHY